MLGEGVSGRGDISTLPGDDAEGGEEMEALGSYWDEEGEDERVEEEEEEEELGEGEAEERQDRECFGSLSKKEE